MPLPVQFWRGMLLVGSSANLSVGFVVLMLIAQGVSLDLAVAMHFLFLPYNLFLTMAVWRSLQGTMVTTSVAELRPVFFTLV